MTIGLYSAAIIGAIAIYLTLPHRFAMAKFGGLLGMAGLAMGFFFAAEAVSGALPGVYFYIFAVIAIASAARVITHPRPVYSALYFVLLVLATSGLLVLLEAEFMAFAMIIIYAGAILVTYMFVIMLATLPQTSQDAGSSPIYDREAREPLIASFMGFAMLAVVGGIIVDNDADATPSSHGVVMIDILQDESKLVDVDDVNQRRRLNDTLRELGEMSLEEEVYAVDMGLRRIDVRRSEGVKPRYVALDDRVIAAIVPNIDQVGQNLFKGHTLGIELAAVILLLSMVGAIVISKRMGADED